MESKQRLFEFLETHNIASLATVSPEGVPHVTTIYNFSDKDLNFYFTTKSETIKYKNIKENSNVALVITDVEELQTIQIEGKAKLISDSKELIDVLARLATAALGKDKGLGELPVTKIKEGAICFFKVVPSWIRWTNFKNKEDIEFEEKF
ncbi:MAG: pyridoxamine 5'-phosphate oxidase family protein [Candidatus Dojkabacteria bacterium]